MMGRASTLRYAEHRRVVLTRDLPSHGLSAGAVGTVVGTYGADGYEVEFIGADGRTVAVATLGESDIRADA
ncbi:DUF4926 domain-containing protein [[Mycobacterium] vasticus]|uniref:DUF4926 domain-containing protein n=1 Tax=[Mycobacterium] vasticus TaxID=2875777 RepID=A0ABU5Z3H7_9MYCO|nr:DUF4926 domain-containing protein [Mycolicibacter sp. MYC017]MEB3071957.1 DUF4926 domain-containing protein [Mycolicibacter sp. MYC017]